MASELIAPFQIGDVDSAMELMTVIHRRASDLGNVMTYMSLILIEAEVGDLSLLEQLERRIQDA